MSKTGTTDHHPDFALDAKTGRFASYDPQRSSDQGFNCQSPVPWNVVHKTCYGKQHVYGLIRHRPKHALRAQEESE